MSLYSALGEFTVLQKVIVRDISHFSRSVRSCLYWLRDRVKYGQRLGLSVYFTAVTFLHVAYKKKTKDPLKRELKDVLATTLSTV